MFPKCPGKKRAFRCNVCKSTTANNQVSTYTSLYSYANITTFYNLVGPNYQIVKQYQCGHCHEKFDVLGGIQSHLVDAHGQYEKATTPLLGGLKEIETLIKQNDVEMLKKRLAHTKENWSEWRFLKTIDVGAWSKQQQESKIILTQLTILHLGIVEHQIEIVYAIIDAALEQGYLNNLLHSKICAEVAEPEINSTFPKDFEWLKEANVIHLSAWFHYESLAYFLRDNNLLDDASNQAGFTPLHIASMQGKAIGTR